MCYNYYIHLGVAQLVARDFWEVEVAGSSPVTQTTRIRVKRKCSHFLFWVFAVVFYFCEAKISPKHKPLKWRPKFWFYEAKPTTCHPNRAIYGIIYISGCGAVGSAQRSGRWGRRFKSDHPDHILHMVIFISGVGAAVARTSGGREVASSILVPPTITN